MLTSAQPSITRQLRAVHGRTGARTRQAITASTAKARKVHVVDTPPLPTVTGTEQAPGEKGRAQERLRTHERGDAEEDRPEGGAAHRLA